jgi:hypothetical protein
MALPSIARRSEMTTMRYPFPISFFVTWLWLIPTQGFGQDTKKDAADHGRVLACCLDVFPHKLKDTTNLADTKNYVFRGRVISLGKDKKVSICYDTEHMRVAGAWIGKPIAFTADKNMGPTVEGYMLFATKPGPGWAKDGKWDDPREGKEGPLPRDWAHYKGLYLHGDKVVLSYTVGDMDVLEMPEVVERDGGAVVTRTFKVGPTKVEQRVLICDAIEGDIRDDIQWLAAVWIHTRRMLLTVISGAGKLEIAGGRLYMKLPRNSESATYKIWSTSVWIEDGMDKERVSKKMQPSSTFAKLASERPDGFASLTKGGPPRWTETLETTGTLGDNKAGTYTLDQIQLPEKNPWNASIRFAGLDFFLDGRAALCTWDGDVWIVSGLDESLKKVRWKRFASGLHAPLGLKIINGIIYVAGRDQITKLHDLNCDGEADFYENFNNDAGLTLQRHEFVMDLQTDKAGNLYYCRSGHYIQSKRGDNCVIYKLSPDGKKLEKIARGFREPNGMSIGPDGTMIVADNEGNGIPQTPIYRLRPGRDYGFTPSTTGKPDDGRFKLQEKPIVWLGPKVDTSAGGQVWAPLANSEGKSWGPLSGKLLHTSYGNCALFHLMIDKTADPWQGAVWKFPLTFNSGIMRARFHPIDGQLYLCGLRGWGTSAVKDGQFCRVRFSGKSAPIPVAYRVVKDGLEFTFSDTLDKASAEDDENWAGTWSEALKKTPSAKELQEMPITTVRLSADRKTVTIGLDKMRAVPNFALQYRIKAADGSKVSGELHGTIHRAP